MKLSIVASGTLLLCLNFALAKPGWNVGKQMAEIEKRNGSVEESLNPNFLAPEWSYGSRGNPGATELKLLENHLNSDAGLPMDGFKESVCVLVNSGEQPAVYQISGAPLKPILPGEMFLRPSVENEYAIVRWTAPKAGDFLFETFWQNIETGGNGVSVLILLNGTTLFQDISSSGRVAAERALRLRKGDLVEFAVGTNGDAAFDGTKFNAIVEELGASFAGIGKAPRSPDSRIHGISSDGLTVVGTSKNGIAFKLKQGKRTEILGLSPDPGNTAYACSEDGAVVVGAGRIQGQMRPFLWQGGNTIPLGKGRGFASSVSDDGKVILGTLGGKPFLWSADEGTISLGIQNPKGTFSLSANGTQVAGTFFNGEKNEAFRYSSAKGMIGLGFLLNSDLASAAADLSADGSILAGTSAGKAFRWENGKMKSLGSIANGSGFEAASVSGDGSVVVGNYRSARGTKPFVWSARTEMQDLENLLNNQGIKLSGWRLQKAVCVSGDGRTLVGNGLHGGLSEGWIVNLPTVMPPPLITSLNTASGIRGKPFEYRIVSTVIPAKFAATELPAGLSLNPTKGTISGICQEIGSTKVVITATNRFGTSSLVLEIVVLGGSGY